MRRKILLAGSLAVVLASSIKPQSQTAPKCVIDQRQPAHRVFAKIDQKHSWKQYRRIEDVPVLDLESSSSAQVWDSPDGFLVLIVEPGEDFWAYTEYCFDSRRRLRRLKYELRTVWGWEYRLAAPVENGSLKCQRGEFFRIDTDRPISKPDQANDVSQALEPTVYVQAKQLPFSKLLLRH